MIKLNKRDSKLTKWLQAATSKPSDNRPVLEGIYTTDQYSAACNGFVLHAAKVEGLETLEGNYNLGVVRAGENILDPALIEVGECPDYTEIMPKHNGNGICFALNTSYLMDTIKGLDKNSEVVFRISANGNPIEIFSTIEDQEVYALIMPIYHEKERERWKPGKD